MCGERCGCVEACDVCGTASDSTRMAWAELPMDRVTGADSARRVIAPPSCRGACGGAGAGSQSRPMCRPQPAEGSGVKFVEF